MGREVRRVPAGWDHPRHYSGNGQYQPLRDGYGAALKEFERDIQKMGLGKAIDYHAGGPVSDDYMPDWPDAERTHYQMYEDTTEGTPISPVMASPEELARWLADTNASAFGGMTATYEQWLPICRGGWAPSMVIGGGRAMSGVEHMAERDK